jgi:hypothetical protein
MTNEEIFELHKLQSANVRKLNQVKKNLIKDINFYLRKSDNFQVEIKTKLLALLYSAWSEAQFIQIVYTPSSFSSSEISSIKNKTGIANRWKEMVNIAIQKVDSSEISSNLQDQNLQEQKDKLIQYINEYIHEPYQLRNKIAHGQWVHALNGNNDDIDPNLTSDLEQLNYIEIIKQFKVHQYLGLIIRDLVQSPNKGFNSNYSSTITKLKNYLDKTTDWNMATRKEILLLKPIRGKTENP